MPRRNKARRLLSALVERYFSHGVDRQSAALAYYLLFALFPFLIFVSSLLGLLQLDVSGIVSSLSPLLPTQVVELAETYLKYVSETSSRAILWFSLVFSVYFPMRAARCLMWAVRQAYHLPSPKIRLVYTLKTLLYTMFLLLSIAATLVLATVGEHVLGFLGLHLPEGLRDVWGGLRFLIIAVVVFAAVGLLYAVSLDGPRRARQVLPGALSSLAAWMALSGAYSYYVENFSKYSLIYGALGAVVILLIWLYMTAVVLIMGAELNHALLTLDKEG